MYFYFGKNACSFRVLVVSVRFCVVANWGYAFFGVYSFGYAHFFIF